eukprot:CAMPEP_0204385098 /NCGR_PEP_ID=MMETSP0469-20131031/57429_1 /ASSEMBLY_ACC=CAM_ASM_000384 /TAXON_ID=2969 /ORGANISM="Oxyrrhis marina" /LENGTH=33 /DNA_ID= /DNA_START= /DNA_END= /DNA_ORIENTATION=
MKQLARTSAGYAAAAGTRNGIAGFSRSFEQRFR